MPDDLVTDGDGEVHTRLGARVVECWARLEDVVSELHAVHEFAEEAIVDYVRSVISAEREV
jgi:hypothetical protein